MHDVLLRRIVQHNMHVSDSNSANQPECAYCHEAIPGTRNRYHPDLGDEDGIMLCRACWLDVQRRFTCLHM